MFAPHGIEKEKTCAIGRKLEPWLNFVKKQVIDGEGIYGIIVVKAGRLIHYAKEKHI